MKKGLLIVLLLLSYKIADACHALALLSPQVQSIPGGIMVTASSDPATCGCSTYWIDTEIWCTAIGATPPGNLPFPPAGAGNYVALNGPYFYTSAEMNKPDCVTQTYPWTTISFAGLCPGITYNYHMREHHNSQLGPWTATFTFTVPGTPPAFSISPSATPNIVCQGGSSQLQANFSGTGGCSNFTYTWSPTTGLTKPPYSATTTYTPGTTPIYVQYGANTYQFVAGSAQTGVTPGTNNAVWQLVNINVANIPNPITTPSATTTYTLSVHETCTGQLIAGTAVIQVMPPAVAGTAAVSPAFICANTCTNLTLTGYTGNIQWQSAPAIGGPYTNIPGGTTTPFQVCPGSTTFYRAEVIGCQNAISNSVQVTVNPAPNVVIPNNHIDICPGGTTTITANGAAIYTWNPPGSPGASVTVSPTATTTYTVTGTTSGCRDTAMAVVRVNPLPPVTAGPDLSTCQGSPIMMTATGANTYQWSPATGLSGTTGASVSANPSFTTTYTLTGTSSAGCINYDTIVVNVLPPPIADAGPSQLTCDGTPVTLNGSGGTTYTWSPATGLSSTTGPTVTATPSVTTTYTLTAAIGSCTSTDTMIVQVVGMPVANAGPDFTICSGTSVPLTASGGTTYSWSPVTALSPSNGIGQSVVATPMSTTTYTVTASNGSCISTDEVEIVVNTSPVTTASADAFICITQTASLTVSGATTYTWNPATGLNTTSGPAVDASPSATTTYTVTGTQNGCTSTDTVIVNVQTAIAVTASADQQICIGGTTQLTVTGAASYEWSPNTAISSTTDSVIIAGPLATTTYTVTGSTNGCSGTDEVIVNVEPLPSVNAGGDLAMCEGSQVVMGGSGAATYLWSPATGLTDPTDPTTTASPLSTTTYTLTGTSAAGCVNFDTMVVTVHPLPVPDFTVQDTCVYLGLNFFDNTSISSGAVTSWFWDFGDGQNSTVQNPVHQYASAGTYPVVLVVQSNSNPACVSVVNKTATVYPKPNAAISGTSVCQGVATTFTNSSTISSGSIVTNSWTFGDGNTSGASNPSHTYSSEGTYNVELIVSSDHNCLDTATTTVMVFPKPTASFTNTSVCNGFVTDFTNNSSVSTGSITGNFWDFGDASTGSAVSPSHQYANAGTYSVELLVTTANGCSDSITQQVLVYPKPDAQFTSNAVCEGETTMITDLSTVSSPGVISTWEWDLGNSTTSNVQNPSLIYSGDGLYNVQLIITTNDGCKDTVSNPVIVNPIPVVQVSSDIISGCTPVCFKFSDASALGENLVTWQWSFGDGQTSNSQNPEHCYDAPGTYDVTLVGTTPFGCFSTSPLYSVTAHPVPVADFSFTPENPSMVSPVVFFLDKSLGATYWEWNYGDSLGRDSFNILTDDVHHEYGDTGTYCITLRIMNEFGCKDSIEKCLHVDPDYVMYIPNAFSPNGDGKNDIFIPYFTGISDKNYEFRIYDRWGNLTFSTKDYTVGWNGKFNNSGGHSPEDVYVYVVSFRDMQNIPKQLKGKVTLLR